MSARTGGASQGVIAAGGGHALSLHPSERSAAHFPCICSTAIVMATPAVTSGILPSARPSLAGSRRSTGRGVKKPGGEFDPVGMLPVGESGF